MLLFFFYNCADSAHTSELQQNGIPEEVESTTVTTPQPPGISSQEFVYESSVDHVTSDPVHSEGTLEGEQFTPTEVESKCKCVCVCACATCAAL